MVPDLRLRPLNDAPLRGEREYVLYWMTAQRRTNRNFALERAVELARRLDRPLVVLEALRCGYRWASDRIHRFVIEGMLDNRSALAGGPVLYHPYVEPERGAGKGLLEALAASACAVVTDEFPCFFLPRMAAAAAGRLDVRLEAVDSIGLLPLRAVPDGKEFRRAYDFRRFVQRNVLAHAEHAPRPDPVGDVPLRACARLPAGVVARWPAADVDALLADGGLGSLPIDHRVPPAPLTGGAVAASRRLEEFVAERLGRYAEEQNHPDLDATSGLSPYLHFGHVSAHEIFGAVADAENWSSSDVSSEATGSRGEWWGTSANAEGFLEQLTVWRELAFHTCHVRADHDTYESLPDWASATLAEHADDVRDPLYTDEQLERAQTHDPLWNAAQTQLLTEGRIHNYLRMLWGKKILEWTASPRDAFRVMVDLNNRYALDGRDPNSWAGISWVLGRYDRPWGPERPIFGKIRYMSSENAARKLRTRAYVARTIPDDSRA